MRTMTMAEVALLKKVKGQIATMGRLQKEYRTQRGEVVTESALMKRINRALAAQGGRRKLEKNRQPETSGARYYLRSAYAADCKMVDDLEPLAKELGVLGAAEVIEQTA